MNNTIFTDILLVYAVFQLITTAYGLTVISALKPIINDKLHSKGYKEVKKTPSDIIEEKVKNVLLAFVPFYYGFKGLKLVQGKVERAVDEEILSGEWITEDEQGKIYEKSTLKNNEDTLVIPEKKIDESLFIPKARVEFEKPETYKARRNDYSIYNIDETPTEFIESVMSNEESLSITPFKYEENNKGLTPEEVASFISELDLERLSELNSVISNIIENEKYKKRVLTLEKDVA